MSTSSKAALRKHGSWAKSVGSFVPKLTGKAFEKYGFSTATLLTDWPMIIGAELAAYTQPERLKWPRNVDAYTETPDTDRGRPGATLVLRVDGARALDVQYRGAQIIDRINAYFGYRAVTELRFIQAPVEPPTPRQRSRAPAQVPSPAPASHPAVQKPATEPATVVDELDPLEAALGRLEESVRLATLARNNSKPAG